MLIPSEPASMARQVEQEDAVASDVEAPVEQEEARRGCGSEGEEVMCDSFSGVKMQVLCRYTPAKQISTTKCTTPREASPNPALEEFCPHLLSPVHGPAVCRRASTPTQDEDVVSSEALRLHVSPLALPDAQLREQERKRGKWGTRTQVSEGGGLTGGGIGAMMQPAHLAVVLQGLPLSNILMVCARPPLSAILLTCCHHCTTACIHSHVRMLS